jgi:ABC-type nickel/cobalt efflux system permease component RcnA
MLWSAFFREPHSHDDRQGIVVGLSAGLIPCPLTLFVMTFAMSRGVPEAGIMFALVMMLGVALTLSAVAVTAVFFRRQMYVRDTSKADIAIDEGSAGSIGRHPGSRGSP